MAGSAHVAILMGTCNGARFLRAQLGAASRRRATATGGSLSATTAPPTRREAILEGSAPGRGPGGGPARALPGVCGELPRARRRPRDRADYYAFADQDDLWHPERLARGLARLAPLPADRPALYGGRTRLIDEAGRACGISPEFRAPPGFGNALVQSIAGGNTMLFNRGVKRLLEAVPDVAVVAHDWWLYQLVSGAGGAVIYDPEPFVDYRQHAGNLIGGNQGVRATGERLRLLMAGRMAEWTDVNLAALEAARPHLTPEARAKVALLRRARGRGLWRRLALMRRLALYRQTRAGTLSLWLAGAARLL